jgi:oligopeptide/dipeptide ABC transporter ATP-binding protein
VDSPKTPAGATAARTEATAETVPATAAQVTPATGATAQGQSRLEARDLAVHFAVRRPLAAALRGGPQPVLRAVDGVTLAVEAGEVVALVGESGSGKTTLGQTMVRNLRPAAGSVLLDGTDVGGLTGQALRELRRRVQVIFQDPYESLNPRQRVRAIVAEGLHIHKLGTADERRQRVLTALADVGLTPASLYLDRYPHELSGGQRQRVAIASCLALRPRFLVADEPVSMLDVSVVAGLLRMFDDLRRRYALGILMITHDLATAAAIADRVAVMYLGRIVEVGQTSAVLTEPQHPYTRALLEAAAGGVEFAGQPVSLLSADPPSPGELPPGCRFRPRCPLAESDCRAAEPDLLPVRDDPPGRVACWHAPGVAALPVAGRRAGPDQPDASEQEGTARCE